MSSQKTCPKCGSHTIARDQAEESNICFDCREHFPYGEDEEEYKYSLDLVDWGFTEIPDWVFDRSYLKKIDLSAEPYDSFHGPFVNRINSISSKIGRLTNLEELDLSCNVISKISPQIGNCVNLRDLYLGRNFIKKIPKKLCRLRNLEVLNLRYNSLKSLPEELGSLTSLKFLNLEGNHLKALPKSVTNLVNLEEFKIKGNKRLVSPPYHIALEGIHAIGEWFENEKK